MIYTVLQFQVGSTGLHVRSRSPENFQSPDCLETGHFSSPTPDFQNFKKNFKKKFKKAFRFFFYFFKKKKFQFDVFQ